MSVIWRIFQVASQFKSPVVSSLRKYCFSFKAFNSYNDQNSSTCFPDNPFSMLGAFKLNDFRLKETDFQGLSSGKDTYTVSVEGNIGSGKTTLLEYFQRFSSVEALQEPVDQWTNIQGHNALQCLYEDPKRWSFTFNMYAQLTRVQMHNKKPAKPIKMLERSLYSTRHCFVENDYRNTTINGMEYAILTGWFDWLVKSEKASLDLIVYVRADPEVCFERIKKRSRKEETLVPFSLLENLHTLHEEWLIEQKHMAPPAPVVVLDANRNYDDMKELYEMNRQQILCGYV